MRLNPYHPQRFWSHLGRAQYTARLYADAIQSFSKLTAPDHSHHAFLAASLAQLGNRTAAGAHVQEVLQREPTFTAEAFLDTLHYQQRSDKEHLRDGLVVTGLRHQMRVIEKREVDKQPKRRAKSMKAR
jgi:adenylate cyclase